VLTMAEFREGQRWPLQPPGFGRALATFRRAALDVPAYGDFLRRNGVVADLVKTPADFARVPPVTKANYLHHYPLNMLAWGGDITAAGTWSTSSGSSGKPTYWPRARLSLEQSIDLYDTIFRQSFRSDERSTLAVIGFAMGNWIGGTYTFTGIQHLPALGHKLSVITPGIDVAAILGNLADLGPYYEQVVLVGYPPFVKDVLDQAPSPVASTDIGILMAGENITESWRDYVLKRIGKEGEAERTCLIYGTADAGIMGHETPTTIAARRLARDDPGLATALFGDDEVQPTFVEYQPGFRFTETTPDGYLLFTVDTAFPLIRYRINDRGSVITAQELARLLDRCGHELRVRTSTAHAGFIALGRRTDIATTFYALKIFPESIRAALEDAELAGVLSGKFHLMTEDDEAFEQTLRLHVELRAGACADAGLAPRLRRLVVGSLLHTNSEYRQLHQTLGPRAEPEISLHRFGTDGFAHGIKHRWTGGPS
jgi:phenylacetate-coenzyme A ligase PaaK-like adenylate-forming protein